MNKSSILRNSIDRRRGQRRANAIKLFWIMVCVGLVVLIVWSIPAKADDLAIQIHGYSYHSNNAENYNDVNTGIALRWYPAANRYYSIGTLKNSESHTSDYMVIGFEHVVNKYVIIGFAGGFITGYERANLLPIIAPSITLFNRLHFVGTPYPDVAVEVSFDLLRFEF